jgi:large subunit ribosomal protein L18
MTNTATKHMGRERRHNRIRAKVSGTSARPRLCVYKSNRYLHAQVIDDEKGVTLFAGSTMEQSKEKKTDGATWLGSELAKRAKQKGVSQVVFDRGGFRYAGRIAALAEAARAGGLQF